MLRFVKDPMAVEEYSVYRGEIYLGYINRRGDNWWLYLSFHTWSENSCAPTLERVKDKAEIFFGEILDQLYLTCAHDGSWSCSLCDEALPDSNWSEEN